MLSMRLPLFTVMIPLIVASTAYAADKHPKGSWILVEINGEKIEGTAPTIRFTEKGIDGYTGVNRFFGKFAEVGEKLFGDGIGMTRRAGSPEAMKLETDYLKALQSVTKHRVEEEHLILENDDEIKLFFKAAPEEKE
jgi:heat shock protein HslJ